MDTFGKRLRRLRNSQGIGIKRLAPDLGVSYSYLSKLENDLINPSPELAERVAHYFGQDPDLMLLAAGRLPPAVLRLLQDDPEQALSFIRERFSAREGRPE
jgi:transcriptional regulator with XRE-family HTH domain